MAYKRILTVQDISCLGQCSLTVALPILSACGHETCVIPSAVLSNHTAFESFTFLDLTEEIETVRAQWARSGMKFSALYTGYLGNKAQAEYVRRLKETCLEEGAPLIVDPAMADRGRLYSGFDGEYVEAMKGLCESADIILPNITEGCLLTDTLYREHFSKEELCEMARTLAKRYHCSVVLTGASDSPEQSGVAVCHGGEVSFYLHEKHANGCHGTGDVYASVFTGAYLQGKSIQEAARLAADFTVDCIELTNRDPDHWYGVKFEPLLGSLIEKLK